MNVEIEKRCAVFWYLFIKFFDCLSKEVPIFFFERRTFFQEHASIEEVEEKRSNSCFF